MTDTTVLKFLPSPSLLTSVQDVICKIIWLGFAYTIAYLFLGLINDLRRRVRIRTFTESCTFFGRR